MQTLIQVYLKSRTSLRDAIAGDTRHLSDYDFKVVREQQPGRNPGWLKLRGTLSDRPGAINVEWHSGTGVPTCRVVNRGGARPHRIIGDFLDYLLFRHRKRIQWVTIAPR